MTARDDPPPPFRLRVVAENGPAEVEQAEAIERTRLALRELMANLLRTSRGGGMPSRVGEQCIQVIDAMLAVRKTGGVIPSSKIYEMLDVSEASQAEKGTQSHDMKMAQESVIRGAMQIVASRLADRPLEVAAGEREIERAIERIRAEQDRGEKE